MTADLRIGLLGVGAWGRNYLRVLGQLGVLAAVCDSNPSVLAALPQLPDGARFTAEPEDLLADPRLDALVIATPAASHCALATRALSAGKHCLVEKPLATSAADAARLCRLADESRLVLMVGHIMLYHPAVRMIKELLDTGRFGEVYYLNTVRSNLGTIRREENVMLSLAPHDISIARYLLGEPLSVSATAGAYVQQGAGIYDTANLVLTFAGGARANLALNWLDPEKVRTVKLVGSRGMALFNDLTPRHKLQIHDKGVDWERLEEDPGGSSLRVRSGEIRFPDIGVAEPLVSECQEFVASIRDGRAPFTPGADGVAVAHVLEAAEASVTQGGAPQRLPGQPT